ncbi:f-box domain-containing [Trichoderma arundinaceum]|uniref:F-box domain-containing n=1 Tax=Trichoderma arundinaceum TaxID=490622 RepID=A0A395NP37_TRIAR|nr:f-box domain-containing [Trichoderma arundinaceum]
MAHLTTLPNEILHNILQWLPPRDLGSLPRVCRALRNFVNENQKLCQDIYLHNFDLPPDDDKLDWQAELHDVVRLENICRREEVEDKANELSFVYEVVNRLLKQASSAGYAVETSDTQYASRNADFLKGLFEEELNRVAFFQKSSLFERVYRSQHHQLSSVSLSKEQRQQSAKLHCLYGKPILKIGRLRSARTYPYACSKVYDIRQYTTQTRWGPFMDDGSDRVDWEKVEAILIVLGNNIYAKKLTRLFNDVWDNPFSGSWRGSFISSPKPDISSLDAVDPYGVTGTWYRIVCFLDYNDFFSYNFTNPDRDEYPLHTLDVGEATRLILMRIHVTKIEQAEPDSEYSTELPIVHYEGVSRPLDDSWDDNASSDLRAKEFTLKGTVGLTKEGEVRWTSVSIFQGHERWKSEGVQVGGVRSARGVIGNWFDRQLTLFTFFASRDYDPHGPCGPSAFWKASDSETARGSHAVLPRNFLLWSALIQMEDSDDPEGDMEYTMENEEEEEDDDSESEPVANELPELLLDAELEIIEITHHIEEPSSGV